MKKYLILFLLLSIAGNADAHIKWFVEFDISDPPQSLTSIISNIHYLILLILSILGVALASILDKKLVQINNLKKIFVLDSLNIARIGTGVFFVAIWLVGGIILTPELLSNAWYIPYVQLGIAISVLFRRSLVLAGIGILFLYSNAVINYGIFHMLDYLTLVGLAIYLILSSFKTTKIDILYIGLIFSFLWSAIEKIAYPQLFYSFLEKYNFLTMGLDVDFFIASAAFVELTLFFLLLICNNITVLLAFLINLLIISGNIYFGKMDAIGHFPANFILLIILIKGTATINMNAIKAVISFLATIFTLFIIYYGLHQILYDSAPTPEVPKISMLKNATSLESEGKNYTIYFSPSKMPLNEYFDMDVQVRNSMKEIIKFPLTIEVDAGMKAHNHGMNVNTK